jgi:hypothetical protein
MQKCYAWVLLAALAWSAGACSSDSARETKGLRAAASRQPLPRTDSLATLDQPLAPPRAPVVAEQASEVRFKTESVAASRHRTAYSQVLGSGAHPQEQPASSDTIATLKLPEAVAETPATTLRQFLASGLAPMQEFVLPPTRDTVLLGAQGTQIIVPAEAWDVPANSGPVLLKMREFYTTPDIILAGLGTTASGQLLETGGMLNLVASTADGRPVALRPGAALRLRMPTKELKPGMQTYWGEPVDGHINWHADTAVVGQDLGLNAVAAPGYDRKRNKHRRHAKAVYDEWPEYLTSERRQLHDLLRQAVYPEPVVKRLRRARRLPGENAFVNAYNRYVVRNGKMEQIRRAAAIEFIVDTTGATTQARMRPGFDPEVAAPVLSAVKTWRQWRPAQLSLMRMWSNTSGRRLFPPGECTHQAVGVVRVMITVSGKILINPPYWDRNATLELYRIRQANTQLAAYRAKLAATEARNVTLTATGSQQNAGLLPQVAQPSETTLYYELSSAGLSLASQWINCDRIVTATQPLLAYKIDDQAPDAQVLLVLRGTRSMVNGIRELKDKKIIFRMLPPGSEATVVAMRWEHGQALLATCSTALTTPMLKPVLSYHPVTMLELQQELAKLD